MLSGPALATVLRESHFQLKRFASDLDSRAQPYQVASRSALGPTWQYGKAPDPVRYHDGQCVEFADGRALVVELQVVFEQDCVTVDGRLSIESGESDDLGDGGVSQMLIDAGPRWARTDEATIAAISETVREISTQPSILEQLGLPVREG